MPKIPTYTSQQNIKAMTPAPLRREAADEFKPEQEIISTLSKVAKTWQDAQDVMDKTNALSRMKIQQAQIAQTAASDNGMVQNEDGTFSFTDNTNQYIEQLEAAKAEVLSSIRNKSIQEQTALEFDRDIAIAQIKIQSDFRDKQMKFSESQLAESMALLQREINSSSGALKTEKINERNAILNANIASGVIDYGAAQEMRKTAESESVRYDIYSDTAVIEDQSAVLQQLKDREGAYSYLDETQRIKLIKESQERIQQNNQTYKKELTEAQNKRINSLYEKINNNEISLYDIDKEMEIPEEEGGISPKTLKSIKQGILNRTEDAFKLIIKDDIAYKYDQAIGKLIDNKGDKEKYHEIMADAFRDGVLDNEELNILNSLKDQANILKENRSTNYLGMAYRSIRDKIRGRKNATDSDVAVAIKQLIQDYGDEKDLEKSVKDIIKQDAINANPSLMNLPEKGKLMVDQYGNKARVFPDGTWEAIKEENNV